MGGFIKVGYYYLESQIGSYVDSIDMTIFTLQMNPPSTSCLTTHAHAQPIYLVQPQLSSA